MLFQLVELDFLSVNCTFLKNEQDAVTSYKGSQVEGMQALRAGGMANTEVTAVNSETDLTAALTHSDLSAQGVRT